MNIRRFGSLAKWLCAALIPCLAVWGLSTTPARAEGEPATATPVFSPSTNTVKRGTVVKITCVTSDSYINWAEGDGPTDPKVHTVPQNKPKPGGYDAGGITLSEVGTKKIWAYAYTFDVSSGAYDTSLNAYITYTVFKPVDTPRVRQGRGVAIETPDAFSRFLSVKKDSSVFVDHSNETGIKVFYGFGEFPADSLDAEGLPFNCPAGSQEYSPANGVKHSEIADNGTTGKIWFVAKGLYKDYSPVVQMDYEIYDKPATPVFRIDGREYASGSSLPEKSELVISCSTPSPAVPVIYYKLTYATTIDCGSTTTLNDFKPFPTPYLNLARRAEDPLSINLCICAVAIDERHHDTSLLESRCYTVNKTVEHPLFYRDGVELKAGRNDTVSHNDEVWIFLPEGESTDGVRIHYLTATEERSGITKAEITDYFENVQSGKSVKVEFTGTASSGGVFYIAAFSVRGTDTSAITTITLRRHRQKYYIGMETNIICFDKLNPFDIVLENARSKCTWVVNNPKNASGETIEAVDDQGEKGAYQNTKMLSIKDSYEADSMRKVVLYAVEEGHTGDFEEVTLIIPRMAAKPGEISVKDYAGNTVDTLFCQKLSYNLFIDDKDESRYENTSLSYYWAVTTDAAAVSVHRDLGRGEVSGKDLERQATYMFASKGDYAFKPMDKKDAGRYIAVRARTCDDPQKPPKSYQSKLIENVVLEKILDSVLTIKAIKFDSDWKEDNSGYACSYYSEEFNQYIGGKYRNKGNGVDNSKKNNKESGNGRIYLQAEPYEFDKLSGAYSYEWIYDTADLEMDTTFMDERQECRDFNFGREKPRCCFKVKHTEGREPEIKVRYRIYCKMCKELAVREGKDSTLFEKVMPEDKPFTFRRIDSLPYIVDYNPYISYYDAEKGGHLEQSIDLGGRMSYPLVCGDESYSLCVIRGSARYKDSVNDEGETGMDTALTYNWVLPAVTAYRGWEGVSDRPCAKVTMPSVATSTSGDQIKYGDSLYFLVYPSNKCFNNGRVKLVSGTNKADTSRSMKMVTFYLSARPRPPVLIDTVEHPNRRYVTPYDNKGYPTSVFPDRYPSVLLCNYNSRGAGGEVQNLLVHTSTDKVPSKLSKGTVGNDEGVGVVLPEGFVSEGDAANTLVTVTPYGRHAEEDLVDTVVLGLKFLGRVRQENRLVLGVFASNQCGAGDTAYFPVNIIDTLVVSDITYRGSGDETIDPGNVCEGEHVFFVTNTSQYITSYNDMGRNTDTVAYMWKLPDCGAQDNKCSPWRFYTQRKHLKSAPEVVLGSMSGSVRLALRNRCGTTTYNSSAFFTITPYTRVDVLVTDLLQPPADPSLPFDLPDDDEDMPRDGSYEYMKMPCAGSNLLYAINKDTITGADEYKWIFPEGWEVYSLGIPNRDFPRRIDEVQSNIAYTDNDTTTNYRKHKEMRLAVRVGAQSGHLIVIGKKDKCGWTYDNVNDRYGGHRADTFFLPVRPNPGKPLIHDSLGWNWKWCVRNPHHLRVLPAAQDSVTQANSYFSWKFKGTGWDTVSYDYSASDRVNAHYNIEDNGVWRTYTITDSNIRNRVFIPSVPDNVTWPQYGNEIVVHANRFDCPTHSGDSTVFSFMTADTLPLDRGTQYADAVKGIRLKSDKYKLCEGDTAAFYIYTTNSENFHDSMDYIWFKWNGVNDFIYADDTIIKESDAPGVYDTTYIHTDSIDYSGWRVLNRNAFYADTLRMIVGKEPMVLSAYGVSHCGWSSPIHSDTIRPIIKIRDTAHWIGRYEILCETEELEMRHDSILYAEGYEWFYPWCDKQLIAGKDTLQGDTLKIKGRPANIPYRNFKAGTVFDSGRIYVRPYNYCGYGPTSDTVEVVSLVHPLARPDSVQWIVDAAAHPMTGILMGTDSILYDTLCLRTDTLYRAFFTDTLYPEAEWHYDWFGLSVHASDSILADSNLMRFKKLGGRDLENTIGVAVRHPACRRYGDTLVLKIYAADTVQMPGNSMQQCLLDLLNEDANMVVTKLCGGSTSFVLWTLNRSVFNDPSLDSTKFVWRKESNLNFARDYTAGPPVTLATGISWLNQRADKFYVNDSLHMQIGNGDSLQVAVYAHNRCGYSRLPYVTVRIVNAVTQSYSIGVLNPVERTLNGVKDTIYCDKETVTFALNYKGDSVNDFVWVLPWKRDTTRSESPVYVVNDTVLDEEALVNLMEGRVYAIPRNGCGDGPKTDSVLLRNIMRERAIPERDKVQDSLCMHTPFLLTVNLPSGGGSDSIRVIWDFPELASVVAFDSFSQDAFSASAKVQQYHIKQRSEPYSVGVSSQVIGCRRISDKLLVTLVPMDTLEFVTDEVSDEFLEKFQVRLEPLLASTHSCEFSSVTFPVRDAFHWSLRGPASYIWAGREAGFGTELTADSLLASSSWRLNAEGTQIDNSVAYTALGLTVGTDSLWLRLRVHNICGSSLSPALIQTPKYHVTQKPSFRFPDNFCIDNRAVFSIETPWPDYAEYFVVEKEWAPGRTILAVSEEVPSLSFTDSITELTVGAVSLRAGNHCEPDGPDSVLVLGSGDIIRPPLRPEPAWFETQGIPEEEAVWKRGDGNRPDTIVQWLCLYEDMPLIVNRHGNRAHVRTRWDRVKADNDNVVMPMQSDNPDTVRYVRVNVNALPQAGDEAIFSVWAWDEICGCYSDTLYIQLILVDTAAASDYRLDWVAADPDVEDLNPKPCIGSEIMFTVRDTATGSGNDSLYYHWTIPDGWAFRTSSDSTYSCEMTSGYDNFPLPDTSDGYSVVVKVGARPGSVRVQVGRSRYRGGCSAFSSPVVVPVQADTFYPRQTLVTGTLPAEDNDVSPCVGSVVTYRVRPPDNRDRDPKAWAWTVPGDWVITDIDKACDTSAYSGDTVWRLDYTGTCTVRVGQSSGYITVTALDSCCGYARPGNTVSLSVTVIDTARFTVSGDHHSCIDSLIDLTVEANRFGDSRRYSLQISGPGRDGFSLAFDTIDAATGKVDSSHLRVSGSSFDTVYLTFTPVNTYGCETNIEPLVWWVKADTTPEIRGVVSGPDEVCEDNLYLFTFHLDDPEGKVQGRVRTRWFSNDDSWEVAEQLSDSSAMLRFKKIPTFDGYPVLSDTVFCSPIGICGTAPLRYKVIRLREADVFDDSIVVSHSAPCLGHEVQARLRDGYDSRYDDTAAYRVVWGTPDAWTLLDNDTLAVRASAHYIAQLDSTSSVITARLWKEGSCGLSKTLRQTVAVRDSAERLSPSPSVKLHPCFKNDEYYVNLLPAQGQVDSVEWFVRLDHPYHSFRFTPYTTKPDSTYKNDSLVIFNDSLPNGETYTKDIYVTARAWNECGSRDTLIVLTPVSGITPLGGHINVPRVCLNDEAYAYIEVPAAHTLAEGITYRWEIVRGNAAIEEEYLEGDTVAYMRWFTRDSTGYTVDSMVVNHVVSSDSTYSTTEYFNVPDAYMLRFTAANDCFTLEDSVEVRPFSFTFEPYANPDTVVFGTGGVILAVNSVTEITTVLRQGLVSAYDYSWEPAERLMSPNPGEDFRRTDILIRNPETFYVTARQKPAQSSSLPVYKTDALCRASDSVRIWLDSVFSMRLEILADTLCVDEDYELRMDNVGGSPMFKISWLEFNEKDSVWELLVEDEQSVVMRFDRPGRYSFMAVGRDSAVLYRADGSVLVNSSSCDTVVFSVVTYDLDVAFTNVASDVITDVPLGSVLELGVKVSLGTGDYHYSWEPESFIERVDEAAGVIYTTPIFGTRSLVLAVTDSVSRCRRELPLTIEPGTGTRVPNTFTPNDDGINDVFMAGVNILSIYSRWGELLVRIEDGSGWDGTYKGKRVRPGEYLYVAEISELGPNGMIERTIKGVVTLKYE